MTWPEGNLVDWVQAVSGVLAAVATFYFTYQLVKNDNAREARAVRDAWKTRIKGTLAPDVRSEMLLWASVEMEIGTLRIHKVEKPIELICEAYAELFYENGGVGPGVLEFETILKRKQKKAEE